MKQLSGKYQAFGANTKSDRMFFGDLQLEQEGAKLRGSYRFSMSWEDSSPVSFGLPEHDCEVEGELLENESALILADDIALLNFKYEHPNEIRPDAILRLGSTQIFIVQLGNGTLINASEPTMVLTNEPFCVVNDDH